MDPKQPLWMPQGSVRALLAFIVVIAVLAMLGSLLPKLDPEKAFLGLVGIMSLILNAYFLTRGASRGA